MTTALILLLIILLFWSAFFSASEIALFSLSNPKIMAYQCSQNSSEQRIARLLARPRELLVTIFMMNTLVNILIQNATSSLFLEASWLLKVAFPLVITLIIGEVIPKYIAMQRNTVFAKLVSPLIERIMFWIGPLREWTVAITTPISRLMFFFFKKETPISEEEIEHVLAVSEKSGVLNPDETQLINGFMSLQDSQVKELMRPRNEVILYNIQEPLTKLIHLFVDEECTRIPVCEGDMDHLLGVLSAQDFLLNRSSIHSPSDLKSFLKKPFFLPESTPCQLLLKRFNERGEKMAFIVDEHRSVTGLITLEDLVEEVVGEITDRRDSEPLYEKLGLHTIVANGKLELETFEELFGVPLVSPNHLLTIGGWLTEKLGDIPRPGIELKTDNFLFRILSADPRCVKKVYIRHLKERK